MSRLADLIVELCPDGVEYRRLDELFATRNGYTPSRSDMSAWDSHDIPWFRMEDIRENGGILDRALTYVSSSAVKNGVLFPENSLLVATSATVGAHALITVPHLSNQRFTSLQLKDEYRKYFDYRFLYYYCFVLDAFCLEHVNVSSFPSVDMRAFRSFKFPFVPLAVQREIVRILDQFTTLEAELEAELEARRTQYEHYRNHLLSMTALKQRCGEIAVRKLGEVGVFHGGLTGKTKADFVDSPDASAFVTYKEIYSRIEIDSIPVGRVQVADKEKQLALQYGDVLFTGSSENSEEVGMTAVVTSEFSERVYLNSFSICFRWSEELFDPGYAKHMFNSPEIRREIQRCASGVTRFNLSKKRMEKISVPVPPLEVQHEIMRVLDDFDALVNDISSGLPAEIAARRAQYEHYRDRMLSFPEKVVSVSGAS